MGLLTCLSDLKEGSLSLVFDFLGKNGAEFFICHFRHKMPPPQKKKIKRQYLLCFHIDVKTSLRVFKLMLK